MNEDPVYMGGCLCGQARYRIDGAPIDAGYCHCRLCQRSCGAPVVAWATFPIGSLNVSGELAGYRSSTKAIRHFCGHCGTQLTFRYLENPDTVDVTLASFDDPQRLPPQYHIWTMSQISWLRLADDLPRHLDRGPDR